MGSEQDQNRAPSLELAILTKEDTDAAARASSTLDQPWRHSTSRTPSPRRQSWVLNDASTPRVNGAAPDGEEEYLKASTIQGEGATVEHGASSLASGKETSANLDRSSLNVPSSNGPTAQGNGQAATLALSRPTSIMSFADLVHLSFAPSSQGDHAPGIGVGRAGVAGGDIACATAPDLSTTTVEGYPSFGSAAYKVAYGPTSASASVLASASASHSPLHLSARPGTSTTTDSIAILRDAYGTSTFMQDGRLSDGGSSRAPTTTTTTSMELMRMRMVSPQRRKPVITFDESASDPIGLRARATNLPPRGVGVGVGGGGGGGLKPSPQAGPAPPLPGRRESLFSSSTSASASTASYLNCVVPDAGVQPGKLSVSASGTTGRESTPFLALMGPVFPLGADLYDGPEEDDAMHGGWTYAGGAGGGGGGGGSGSGSGGPPTPPPSRGCMPFLPCARHSGNGNGRGRSRGGILASTRATVSQDDDRDDDDKPGLRLCSDLRGFLNMATLVLLAASLVFIFAGWPILTAFRPAGGGGGDGSGGESSRAAALRLGLNQARVRPHATLGWAPLRHGLIDEDTPASARFKTGTDGTRLRLVFSDEFNTDQRTFFPGDDPYWLAQDLYYWGTGDYEYYHPSAVTTRDGYLSIKMSEQPIFGRNFKSGMINAWNSLCFTGGRIEMAVRLPGAPNISGLWPAAWLMGNLGRAGYGASTHGTWPYSYDTCDVGTLANQTYGPNGTGGPLAAEMTGVWVASYGPALSYLPGQRLSRCTCSNSTDHPGPRHADGTWKGRSAPELDIFEASAQDGGHGWASMSLQLGPYDSGYNLTRPDLTTVYHPERGDRLNDYTGSPYQQAVSAIIRTNQDAYEVADLQAGLGMGRMVRRGRGRHRKGQQKQKHHGGGAGGTGKGKSSSTDKTKAKGDGKSADDEVENEAEQARRPTTAVYGLEYVPSTDKQDDGVVTWIADGDKAWTLPGAALGPNRLTEIGQRLIPQEPMYPIMNLGMSDSFTWLDWEKLQFPAEMLIDWVRIWQAEDAINLGCDGHQGSMPTSAYIHKHAEAYANANLTTWTEPREQGGYGKRFPGHAMLGQCA